MATPPVPPRPPDGGSFGLPPYGDTAPPRPPGRGRSALVLLAAFLAVAAVSLVVVLTVTGDDGPPDGQPGGPTAPPGSSAPPPGIPSELPGGFPSRLPSGFPSGLPSGLESLLPSLGDLELP
ncbi:hypothetical protein [Streptomyces sp. NA02536]|uniref:hypothetical protein n=1 Tax=Streptomyces sp. NA02536 TaxID=2742133 RepID=UPI0020CB5893|nr:hypothetical protein [Streptomyces sp. NA02536]